MTKKLLKYLTLNAVLGIIIIFLVIGLGKLQKCGDKPTVFIETAPIPEKTYRPPIVKIPFVSSKLPVEAKRLPIAPKDIDKTIEILIPTGAEGAKKVEVGIVIDKQGRVYGLKSNLPEVEIVITKWRPRLFAPEFRFGFSLVYSGKIYSCLSLDYFRIWELHIGSDLGVNQEIKFMAGLHVRYKIFTGGYDFLNKKIYAGLALTF